jgi:hypothetical protein
LLPFSFLKLSFLQLLWLFEVQEASVFLGLLIGVSAISVALVLSLSAFAAVIVFVVM